jgi:hypothetical protein
LDHDDKIAYPRSVKPSDRSPLTDAVDRRGGRGRAVESFGRLAAIRNIALAKPTDTPRSAEYGLRVVPASIEAGPDTLAG